MSDQNDLSIDVGVALQKLNRQIARVENDFQRAAQRQEREFSRSNARVARQFEQLRDQANRSLAGIRMPDFGKVGGIASAAAGGFIGAVLGGLASDQIVRSVRARIADVSETIGKAADRASIATEALQGLQHGFELSGVSAQDLNGSLERFAQRVGEAANGAGPLTKVMERYRLSVRTANGEMKDQMTILREVSDLIRRAGSDQERTAIAQAAFGNAGRAMVLALKNGSDGLDEMIARAREGGFVIEDELVRKAEELDDKFAELTKRVGVFGKRLAIAVADAVVDITDLRAQLDQLVPDEAQGRAILGDEVYDALQKNREVLTDSADSVRILKQEYDSLAGSALEVVPALLEAAFRMEVLGRADVAAALRDAAYEMDELLGAWRRGDVEGEKLTERLQEIETYSQDAFQALSDGDRVQFGGVMSRLGALGSMIAAVASEARAMTSALAEAAGISPSQKQGGAMRQRQQAEADSMASLEAQRAAMDSFVRSEQARNEATAEQLRLEREIEAVRERAREEGVGALTAAQAEAAARAAIAADDARREAGRGSGRSGGRSGGRGGRSAASDRETVDDYMREARAIRDRTEALQIEAAALVEAATGQKGYGDAIEYARRRADLLVAAQRAGRQITPELRAEIDALAAAYVTAGRSAEDAAESMRRVEQINGEIADAIAGAAIAGESLRGNLARVFQGIARDILSSGIKDALMSQFIGGGGGGGGGGFFASLLARAFGGFRERGGPVSPGRAYVVGEKGPEVIVPRATGTVIPAHALGGSGTPKLVFNNYAPGVEVVPEYVSRDEVRMMITTSIASANRAQADRQYLGRR